MHSQGNLYAATNHFRMLRLSCAPGMDWAVLAAGLNLLLHAHGDNVLRTKGIVNVKDVGEVALNAVQHVVYPPEHLGGGPDNGIAGSEEVSEMVFTLKDLDPESVRRSFTIPSRGHSEWSQQRRRNSRQRSSREWRCCP